MELAVRDTPEMITSAAILSGFARLFAEKLLLLEGKTLATGGSIEVRSLTKTTSGSCRRWFFLSLYPDPCVRQASHAYHIKIKFMQKNPPVCDRISKLCAGQPARIP